MISVPRHALGDQDYEWRPLAGLGWWFWKGLVMLQCPNGHCCHLPHAIAADGTVTPSAVCPVTGCGFHEHLKLDGWDLGAKPDKTTQETVLEKRKEELGL